MLTHHKLDGESWIVDVGGTHALCTAHVVVGIRAQALEALAVLPQHHVEQHVEQDDDEGSQYDFCSGATAVPEDVVADDARSCVQSYRTVDR